MEASLDEKSSLPKASNFAKTLLDLLQSSYDSRENTLTSEIARDAKNGTAPISLAMHLVSVTAAFYQECNIPDEQQRYFNEENDRIMSKIPHDAKNFTEELLKNVRILIVRTIVSMCNAGTDFSVNMEEILGSKSAKSLIKDTKDIISHGGLVPQVPQVSVSNGHKLAPQVEISKSQHFVSALPPRIELASNTLKCLMEVLTNGVDVNIISSEQITDLVLMLHEFDRCCGYDVLEKVIEKIVTTVVEDTEERPSSPLTLKSPKCSKPTPTAGNKLSELAPGTVRQRNSSASKPHIDWTLRPLLKSFEDVLRIAKRLKTDYLHEVTCNKRSHRHCDLSISLHQHHDIMGLGITKCTPFLPLLTKNSSQSKSSSKWKFSKPLKGSESPKLKSKKKHKHKTLALDTPSPCVISRAIQFLVERIFVRFKPCARLLMTTIDLIGVCHCSQPRTILVPLLSSLPHLSPTIQDVVLATTGRMLLQRMGPKARLASHKSQSKSEDGILTLELPNHLCTVRRNPFCDEDLPMMQRVNPFDIPDSPKKKSFLGVSKYPVPQNSENFEKLLAESDDFTWLCLAAYKDLILPKTNNANTKLKVPMSPGKQSALPLKVASHLAAIAVHFDLQPLLHVLTTVILPVLRCATGDDDSNLASTTQATPQKRKNFLKCFKNIVLGKKCSSVKNFQPDPGVHPQVIIHCLEILSYHLDKNPDFRRVFLRYSGISPLTILLVKDAWMRKRLDIKRQEDSPWLRISDLSASCLTALLRNATTLSSDARILLLHEVVEEESKSPKVSPKIKRKNQEKDVGSQDSGMLSSFMKGFSPLKPKSPKNQRHFPSLSGAKSPDLGRKNDPPTSRFTWREHLLDEIKVFHSSVQYFLSCVLSTLTELATSQDDGSEIIENGLFDDEDEVDVQRDSRAESSSKHDATLDDEDSFVMNLDLDGIALPVHDMTKMQGLANFCFLLASILPDNTEVQDAFFNLDGSDVILRILTLVAASLIPANVHLDFTFASSETSSLTSFLLQSVEEHTRARAKTEDSTTSISTIRNLDVQNPSSQESKVTTYIPSTEREVGFEEDEIHEKVEDKSAENLAKLMNLKFNMLSSTLSLALLSAVSSDENDITSDEIIDTLKPLLQQSQLTSGEHCKALCVSLFNATVQSELPEIAKASVSATMSSLKQQISSPKHPGIRSPGYQRYSLSFFQSDSPASIKKTSGKRTDSLDSAEFNFSEMEDNSSVYDMMLNVDDALASDEDDSTADGYQGDSESDKPDLVPFTSIGDGDQELTSASELLVKDGTIAYPELTSLMIQLLGDAGGRVNSDQKAGSSQSNVFTRKEHTDNIRFVLRTIISLLKYSPENFEKMLSGCDLPLACLESFKTILRDSSEDEQDIRQSLLELCLTLNNHRMSARHLRLILSFFNSTSPPMDQLLQYLLLLIQHQHPGPSQYLQFPVTGSTTSSSNSQSSSENEKQYVDEAYSLSVWRIAPLRMPLVSNIHWPATNIGITVSLWLQVGPLHRNTQQKHREMDSWDSGRVIVIDIDHSVKKPPGGEEQGGEVAPYHHLVSIGSKQTMLQVWLEGGNLIFRVCVDPDDGRPVGVLAQTECSGILLTNGEWQHLTLNYTENKLPDKTILGKVHIIANCTTERDVILEHNMPKNSRRSDSSHRRSDAAERKDQVSLFVGHWIRPISSHFFSENVPGYKLGTVMLFEGIHFSMRSAFAIYRRGSNITNLTDCLVSDTDTKNEKKSSASVSSRIRLSSNCQIMSSMSSPLSPTPGLESGSNPQFFLLPHSLLLSDLVTEEFFSNENLPSVKNLQEHLVLTYSPTDPGIYLSNPINVRAHEIDRRRRSFSLFSSSPSGSIAAVTENFDPLTQQCIKLSVQRHIRVKSQWNRGLHRALNQVGGIQVFLMLCAKVVEVTASSITQFSSLEELRNAEKIQCLALEALLKLRATDSKRQEEFTSQNVAGMLHKLLTKSQCVVGFRTLQILFNAACSGDEVIINLGDDVDEEDGQFLDQFEINPENSALLHDQELLQVFLTDWQIWHKAVDLSEIKDPDDRFPVWSLLLQGLLSLVRVEHPHQWFNSKSLLRAGIVHRILTGLQQMVTDEVEPLPGPSVTSHMMELFRALIGSPPNVIILSKICDFLIATHPPASTFVCHTPSTFYFNLRLFGNKRGHGYKSQPLSPKQKKSPTYTERPKISRSKSAPANSNTPKRILEALWPGNSRDTIKEEGDEISNDKTARGDFETESDDVQIRKPKGLSIIEEGGLSQNANSSRNTTPPHDTSDTISQVTLTTSTKSERAIANHSSSSWEDVPHTVNPVATSPKALKSPPRANSGQSLEDLNFDTRNDISTPSSKFSSPKSVFQPDLDVEDELSYVTCELLKLLFMAVMTMPDVEAFEMTAGPLCAKALVVSVHHKSSSVRTETLRMLAAYFSRCSEKAQDEFLKERGFHLVANQLYQHSATRSVVDACLYFLLGHPATSAEVLPLDGAAPDPGMLPMPAPDPFTNHAAVLLLAAMGNTTHDPALCQDLVARLQELFECMGPIADVMLDNGLTLALCNLITSVLSPTSALEEVDQECILEEIQHFMTCIAVKACVTAGTAHFQVFEDLFTLLHIIEDDQGKLKHENSAQNVSKIQNLSFHILLMVLQLMQKSAGGKSPMVPRRLDPMQRTLLSVSGYSISSRTTHSRRSSAASTHSAVDSNRPPSPDYDLSMASLSTPNRANVPSASSSRRTSLSPQNQSKQVYPHRRSLSTPHNNTGETRSVMRSHGGGLRTRSFKGSQRRRINEAETARRLQRIVIITVDKLVYKEKGSDVINRSDKDLTFSSTMNRSSRENSQQNEIFQEEETENFGCRLFHTLMDWLHTILLGGGRGGSRHGSSRYPSSSSFLTASTSSQGWERILNISKDSLLDQAVRLFVHLMSPWQADLQIRTFPLSIARRQNADRILMSLFPKDSKSSKKVSVYLYYLLFYYKQQMTSQEKKEVQLFGRLFQRCGGKIYPIVQSVNGVSGKDRSLRSSISEKEVAASQQSLVENIEKSQELFDNERQRDIKIWRQHNETAFDQLRMRTDQLSHAVSQHAMDVTQQVVLRQNIERKKMIAHMKDVISNDLTIRKQWAALLEKLAHERAVWYDEKRYPKSWQLDATEGPNRERRRLQRCHLNIEDKFMMKKTEACEQKERERKRSLQEMIREMVDKKPAEENQDERDGSDSTPIQRAETQNLLSKRPLSFLFDGDSHSSDSVTIRTRLQTNERISVVQSCTNVTASSETMGEVLIGESSMYFVGDEKISDLALTQVLFGECEVLVLSWCHEEVAEVHKRWWQLQDIAIEIFLTNGKTYLLAFKSAKERDIIVKKLKDLNMPNMLIQDSCLETLTQIWRNGGMTNFEYLTQLNKSAGRSFNDLMQYPVMPFVLADYTSAILDLNNVETFRNLLRPISVPDDARMQHYRDRYKFLRDDYNNCTDDERQLRTPPFHYGSHYSNSGTVLHFLVRLPPYTQMFLEYQDASFDIPDRTFHSMETTFRLSCYSSTTDVKELVPEFFFLPEFLCNLEGFDFGLRQCGLRVNHVTLPPWSKADPRLFVLIHRQALESDYVSANLHGWVDLVFGYKQTGKAAIEAVNVFHPATYFGMDVSSVEDPVKRRALQTMIKTYGQTPKLLFLHPHPSKNIKSEMKDQVPQGKANDGSRRSSLVPPGKSTIVRQISVKTESNRSSIISLSSKSDSSRIVPPQRPLSSVLGLKWGCYLGSPSSPDPAPFLVKPLSEPIGSLIPLQTGDVCALAPKMGLLVIYNRKRGVHSYETVDIKWSALLTFNHPDNIVRLKMRKSLPDVNLFRTPADDRVTCCAVGPDCRAIILGHRSGAIIVNRCNPLPDKAFDLEFQRGTTLYGHFAEITCLVACGDFRVLASGSKDGTVILWDLDALTYIRSLTGHATAVSAMAVSRTSGDVCTVCNSGNDGGSHIRLWTINGSLLAAQDTKHRVNCVVFSSAPEGISVNVVAGGMSNGIVRLWSSWDLTPIRDIEAQGVQHPITSITYAHNSRVLYAATENGCVIGWCFKDRVEDKQPILISFLNVSDKS